MIKLSKILFEIKIIRITPEIVEEKWLEYLLSHSATEQTSFEDELKSKIYGGTWYNIKKDETTWVHKRGIINLKKLSQSQLEYICKRILDNLKST